MDAMAIGANANTVMNCINPKIDSIVYSINTNESPSCLSDSGWRNNNVSSSSDHGTAAIHSRDRESLSLTTIRSFQNKAQPCSSMCG